MKKFSIFLLGALGMLAATSCAEKIDPALPQANPQEPILTTGDVVSEKAGVLASGTLTLEDYTAAGATVPVMKLVETKDLPAGATVGYKVQLSATEDFKRVVTLNTTATEVDGQTIYVADAAEWNEAHLYLFGKSPKVKDAYYRVPVYVNFDGSDYRLQSTDYYACTGMIQETCQDQGFTISDAYYFLSDATSWSLGDMEALADAKFEHSDADVYDDPVFVFKFKLTEADFTNADGTTKDGIYWKIASQEGMDLADWATGIYGPEENGDENLDGVLVDVNAQAGKLIEPGQYKLTINMEEMTYSFEILNRPEYLYTPGGFNGWSQLNSAYMQYDSKNDVSKGYYGFFGVDGAGFKICTEPSWDDAVTYGAETDVPALSGTFVLGGAGKNIMVPEAGMFWASVQYDEAAGSLVSYELTPITRVGVIGSFAGSGWGSDVEMTTTDGGITYTATITLAVGDQWKIRFNDAWDYSLGGEPGNPSHAVLDGDNYSAAEAGTFLITLTTQPGIPVVTAVMQ
ncbi:MAG: hypothetical protein K2L97_02070 [Muribaculaceae bacterium]|nr:hypothetical protein [Muribaculaceae bacterium]